MLPPNTLNLPTDSSEDPKLYLQARVAYMQSEIQRFEDYQAQVFRSAFRQTQPE